MLDYARDAAAIVRGRAAADLTTDRALAALLTHYIAMIGEAASHVSDIAQSEHSEIAWAQIIGMRNRLIHGYDQVRLDILWAVATGDIPLLIRQLEAIVQVNPGE